MAKYDFISESQPLTPTDGNGRKKAAWFSAAALVLLVSVVGIVRIVPDGTTATEGGYRSVCEDKFFTKKTVKSLITKPVGALLESKELKGEKKFEASDVITLGDHFYAICDSSWSILRVHKSLPTLSPLNSHIGMPQHGAFEGESGFEGIFHDASEDGFYVVRESVDISGEMIGVDADDDDDDDDGSGERRLGLPPATNHPSYHAMVLKVEFDEDIKVSGASDADSYEVIDACPSEIKFDGDSKGFEGATSLRGADGILYLLGLCEGNHCAEGKRGKELGHGRVVVMQREAAGGPTGGCWWKTVATLNVPGEAKFQDYSAIAIHQPSKSVVITSQENSQLWMGTLSTATNGQFKPHSAAFGEGKVLNFPRNDNCEIQYCNVEGIHFVDTGSQSNKAPQVLVAVSDKMKSKGRQGAECLDKDQAFAFFAVP